jgi:hypothetical protein
MEEQKVMHDAVRFHDKNDKSWMNKTVEFDVTKKSPEHRRYLVLVYFNEQVDALENTFIIAEGRTETYFAIKGYLEEMNIEESVVMLEGNKTLVDQISVLQFLRHIIDDELVEDPTQDIVMDILDEYEGVE